MPHVLILDNVHCYSSNWKEQNTNCSISGIDEVVECRKSQNAYVPSANLTIAFTEFLPDFSHLFSLVKQKNSSNNHDIVPHILD